MPGEAKNSDLILRQANQSLVNNRDYGGRRNSIGRRSAALKREHAIRQTKRAMAIVGAIVFAAATAGLILDGIGVGGVILTM